MLNHCRLLVFSKILDVGRSPFFADGLPYINTASRSIRIEGLGALGSGWNFFALIASLTRFASSNRDLRGGTTKQIEDSTESIQKTKYTGLLRPAASQ